MVEQDDEEARISLVLRASADATRRRILTLLARDGAMRITDLAAQFDFSLNAISKHVKVLEAAGLVNRESRWREQIIRADLSALAVVDRWMDALRWVEGARRPDDS